MQFCLGLSRCYGDLQHPALPRFPALLSFLSSTNLDDDQSNSFSHRRISLLYVDSVCLKGRITSLPLSQSYNDEDSDSKNLVKTACSRQVDHAWTYAHRNSEQIIFFNYHVLIDLALDLLYEGDTWRKSSNLSSAIICLASCRRSL